MHLKPDLKRVARLSEEGIAKAATSDPDARLTHKTFRQRAARVKHPLKKPTGRPHRPGTDGP